LIYTFFLLLLVLASAVLVLAILFQSGKGGGLAANFGGAGSSSDSFLGSRQASDLLTKSSWVAGGVFLFLSFVLSQASARPAVQGSVLDQPNATQTQSPPQPISNAPAIPLNPLPLSSDSGAGKAAATGKAADTKAGDAKATTGKSGDTKTPVKTTPPPQQ
jgi:preprotein translocase subunit SecG